MGVIIGTRTRLRIVPFHEPRDLWIGMYTDRDGVRYICPLPTLGFRVWKEEVGTCPRCFNQAYRTAHLDGDEWYLGWECENDCLEEELIEWPFGDRVMTGSELERLGYTLV